MHRKLTRGASLTESIIAGAIEVHREFGPGLLESVYEWALGIELQLQKIPFVTQKNLSITYKGARREEPLRFDLLVDECVLVEAKAVQEILPIHKAQLLSYMKLPDVPVGLLINFNEMKLADGVNRLILPGANK